MGNKEAQPSQSLSESLSVIKAVNENLLNKLLQDRRVPAFER